MRGVGQTMTTTLSLPILGVAAAGLSAAAGFEQSMNQIQVVGGVAADAMSSLNDRALQLGAETSFSAGEAAQGMLELAKAGLTADEVMGSIGGTLDLAAAGNLSVGQAAEITANAMNAFSLPAEDATRVANLLAAAANSSSVEVTDMAQAFQMSAAVFGSNKVPIDQLSAAIAILGNNGLKGSDAGTSMKTMLMRLTAPTKEAMKEMRALGLQVYNADGSMRNFQDILADLGSTTANLTDEQRNMSLTTLFGADAIRAANILIKEGAGEFENMMGAVNQAGAATDVANARMKGLAGAIQYIKGTIESLMIGAFQPFLQGMADMIRGVADAMAAFGQLPQPIINAALAFLAVLGVAGPIIFAIGQIGVVMGALLSPIGLVVLAIAALAAAWAADFMGIRGLTLEAWTAIQPTLQAIWGWLGVNIPAGLAVLQGWWASVWPALSGAVTAAWTGMSATLTQLWGWLSVNIPAGLAVLQGWWAAVWPALSGAVTAAWGAVGPTLQQLWGWLSVNIPAGLAVLQGWWAAVWPALSGAV
ncbi:MAG: phage tail tape measure protein, partial [Nitrospiraceae bacterium]